MDIDKFQENATRTALNLNKNDALLYYALMLVNEASECGQLIRKAIFQGHELSTKKLIEELGDTLWALANLTETIQSKLSEIAVVNQIKLTNRYPTGFTPEASINRKE